MRCYLKGSVPIIGSNIVEDPAPALTQTAVFISSISSPLEPQGASCASDSSELHANREGSNRSAVSSGLATTQDNEQRRQSIHQLLLTEAQTKRTDRRKGSLCLVCVRQSQVKCWGSRGEMSRRRHKATTVHGCLSLQGSTPLLSW